MQTAVKIGAVLVLVTSIAIAEETKKVPANLFPNLRGYVEQRIGEFDKIPEERKVQLDKIARYVQARVQAKEPATLTFICTHNSRRSHLSQIFAAVAAGHYGIPHVETYSGGTEATAFNPRAISAIERAGLRVKEIQDGKNPRYEVRFHETDKPLVCFSKVYNAAPNPKSDYCAVMVCSQADKNCPNVSGAALRIALSFEDPKVADNTPQEAAKYDERCQQICREMLYLFSRVDSPVSK